MDFNPITDRLRIIGDNGQNLSVVPDTGVATEQTDLDVTAIVAGAYDADGALYAMTATQLVRFADPSTGVSTPVSAHAAIFGSFTAFDISPADGTAFIAQDANVQPATNLFTLSLPDGDLSNLDRHVPGDLAGRAIRGIAVASPGRVRFSVANYSALESAGSALITLQREAGTSGPITVRLTVTAGTATSPADFIGFNSMLEFADGEVTKTLNVPIVNDALDENDETVTPHADAAGPRRDARHAGRGHADDHRQRSARGRRAADDQHHVTPTRGPDVYGVEPVHHARRNGGG